MIITPWQPTRCQAISVWVRVWDHQHGSLHHSPFLWPLRVPDWPEATLQWRSIRPGTGRAVLWVPRLHWWHHNFPGTVIRLKVIMGLQCQMFMITFKTYIQLVKIANEPEKVYFWKRMNDTLKMSNWMEKRPFTMLRRFSLNQIVFIKLIWLIWLFSAVVLLFVLSHNHGRSS